MDDGGFSRREMRGEAFIYRCPFGNSIRDAGGTIEDCGVSGQYCGQCKVEFSAAYQEE